MRAALIKDRAVFVDGVYGSLLTVIGTWQAIGLIATMVCKLRLGATQVINSIYVFIRAV